MSRKMTRALKIIAAVLCITCVLALCIAPWVDPPNTVFKSLQMILLLALSIATAVLQLCEFIAAASATPARPFYSRPETILRAFLPLELNCVRQC